MSQCILITVSVNTCRSLHARCLTFFAYLTVIMSSKAGKRRPKKRTLVAASKDAGESNAPDGASAKKVKSKCDEN